MQNFEDIGNQIELESRQTPYDRVRRSCLQQLHKKTGRNVITYYSSWLHKPGIPSQVVAVTDLDIQGFMGACNGLDRGLGLDLLLHTPGGQLSATQAIVNYLHQMFDDIRVVVPQLAMSAGTMIACSARSILMGKQSSLGPIDPQLGGMPAHGVLEEFNRAFEEIRDDTSENQAKRSLWQPILSKYPPALIGECQKAIELAEDMVTKWLQTGMLSEADDPEQAAQAVVDVIGSHAFSKQHDRHFSLDECKSFGLKIEELEEEQSLQDAVLAVHHACNHTLGSTHTVKIIENHNGLAFNVEGAPVK